MKKWIVACALPLLFVCGLAVPVQSQSWDASVDAPPESDLVLPYSGPDAWSGNMTVVMQATDLGVSEATAPLTINFMVGDQVVPWVLGQNPEGWTFSSNDSSESGYSSAVGAVSTGGIHESAILRVVVVDANPADSALRVQGYRDGSKVYDSAVNFTKSGVKPVSVSIQAATPVKNYQFSWARAAFNSAYAPGKGPQTPNGLSDTAGWGFVYNGDVLPTTLISNGRTDWEVQEAGNLAYESISFSMDAQVGGIWSRLDDNSGSPNSAQGYVVAKNIYDKWTGRMTLVMRIKDLGTNSEKSVVDIRTNGTDPNGVPYWTLGHVAEGTAGPAGWEFGQTNDGRNGNGTNNDTRTGGFEKWVILRIVVIDDDPNDGMSLVQGWQNGVKVYESVRTDDIGVGQFHEIAFRRTSGGSPQKLAYDWVAMDFGHAWPPGYGPETPAGRFDAGGSQSATLDSNLIDGVIGLDRMGLMKTVSDPSLPVGLNKLFEVDRNGMPVTLSMFYLGFDAMRDIEPVGNSKRELTGLMALDKYAGYHTVDVQGPGDIVTGPSAGDQDRVAPGIGVKNPANGPKFDYFNSIVKYNAAHPGSQVGMVYFPFSLADIAPAGVNYVKLGGNDDGLARDIEPAVDWRQATNAFQGAYVLDVFGGVHYLNNGELLNVFQNNTTPSHVETVDLYNGDPSGIVSRALSTQGIDLFQQIVGFKPVYLEDYAGTDSQYKHAAPYFSSLPIARDLEVISDFVDMTPELVNDSKTREQLAVANGVTDNGTDTSVLYEPIAIPDSRLDVSSPNYTKRVLVTKGYAILDGYGAVHSMVEDNGVPVPAPWENAATGRMDPSVNAPYFGYDLAVDFEVFPNGAGYALLTRLGDIYVVNAVGTTMADNFADVNMFKNIPFYGFDLARDLTLVAGSDGKIVGAYVLDRFGSVTKYGSVPAIPGDSLFLPNPQSSLAKWEAIDLEFSPYQSHIDVTPTPTPTFTPTPVPTNTPVPTVTETPTPEPTATPEPAATATPVVDVTPTATPVPAEATPTPATPEATATPVSGDATPTPAPADATATPVPADSTATPVPAEGTPTPVPGGEATATPTPASVSPTSTPVPASTATPAPTAQPVQNLTIGVTGGPYAVNDSFDAVVAVDKNASGLADYSVTVSYNPAILRAESVSSGPSFGSNNADIINSQGQVTARATQMTDTTGNIVLFSIRFTVLNTGGGSSTPLNTTINSFRIIGEVEVGGSGSATVPLQ